MSTLNTPTFFYGMDLGEEIEVEIEQGKTLIVKLVSISEAQDDGTRVVYFELNGQSREVVVKDENIKSKLITKPEAEPNNDKHIGATMQALLLKLLVRKVTK